MIKFKSLLIHEDISDPQGVDWLKRHNAKFDNKGRVIAYHATSRKNVQKIRMDGFREGSYFNLNQQYVKSKIASHYNFSS